MNEKKTNKIVYKKYSVFRFVCKFGIVFLYMYAVFFYVCGSHLSLIICGGDVCSILLVWCGAILHKLTWCNPFLCMFWGFYKTNWNCSQSHIDRYVQHLCDAMHERRHVDSLCDIKFMFNLVCNDPPAVCHTIFISLLSFWHDSDIYHFYQMNRIDSAKVRTRERERKRAPAKYEDHRIDLLDFSSR